MLQLSTKNISLKSDTERGKYYIYIYIFYIILFIFIYIYIYIM
jgi:hypothetical protein